MSCEPSDTAPVSVEPQSLIVALLHRHKDVELLRRHIACMNVLLPRLKDPGVPAEATFYSGSHEMSIVRRTPVSYHLQVLVTFLWWR